MHRRGTHWVTQRLVCDRSHHLNVDHPEWPSSGERISAAVPEILWRDRPERRALSQCYMSSVEKTPMITDTV